MMLVSRLLAALLAAFALLALVACGSSDPSAEAEQSAPSPALWLMELEGGERGWLFGTIHTLPPGTVWRTEAFDTAFAQAATLVVEIAGLEDQESAQAVFAELARTPGLGPLTDRAGPARAQELRDLLTSTGFSNRDFRDVETWGAALMLGRAAGQAGSGPGADAQILAAAGKRRIVELEGLQAQLGIFDALTPEAQVALLLAVAEEAGGKRHSPAELRRAWRNGDMRWIAARTREGMMAHPELRARLLVDRNRAWAAEIGQLLARDQQPFVAVGAAHLVGEDGLPALLEAAGIGITRIQ